MPRITTNLNGDASPVGRTQLQHPPSIADSEGPSIVSSRTQLQQTPSIDANPEVDSIVSNQRT